MSLTKLGQIMMDDLHNDPISTPDEVADSYLLLLARQGMSDKLADARDKGRGGWWSEECSNSDLLDMLKDHIHKGDMRDVMNLAAMIYCRETLGIEEYE